MIKILPSAFVLGCLLLSTYSFDCRAQGREPQTKYNSSPTIRENDEIVMVDDKYSAAKAGSFNWASQTSSVTNVVSLRIIDTQVPVPSSFSCEIDVLIEYYSDPQSTSPQALNTTLKVSNEGSHHKIADHYTFSGGYHVNVKVLHIRGSSGSTPPAVLLLGNSMLVNRTYKFNPDFPLNMTGETVYIRGTTAPANQLKLTWDRIDGAQEYDLEWTTIDEGSSLNVNNVTSPELLFKNNATRITSSGNEYLVSLVYSTKYVAARIRQVQYASDGIRLEGTWDYKLKSGGQAIWDVSSQWYEPNLNWQYSASFAEEGKKKEIVNYFDGTLRGRQTTTLSDTIALVQENVFDEFGRSVASILPTPVKETLNDVPYLHYFKNFNLNGNQEPYSFNDIIQGCELKPMSLSQVNSGASNYYSPSNSFLNRQISSSFLKYIPDAEGFPLSISQYTPDNTGRIRIQGGVGPAFQPGGASSKTTKYYYGKPEQWELDRLFGNDVGFAHHYLKNTIVDPNGQVSISYLNASGKTIATALAGNAPASQDALSEKNIPVSELSVILKPEQFKFNATDLKLSATTTYLASSPGNATISYDIEKLIACYKDGPFDVCSNCYYDLTIKVKNDCGDVLYDSDTKADRTPFKIGSLTRNDSDKGVHYASLDPMFFDRIGEYYISFEWSLNNKVIEHNTDTYIKAGQDGGYIRKEFDFIMDHLNKLDLSAFGDCSTCLDALGSKETFTAMFVAKLSDLDIHVPDPAAMNSWISSKYTDLLVACTTLAAICPVVSPCEKYAKLMEIDVQPGGQFALFGKDGEALEPSLNVLYRFWRTEFPITVTGNNIPESDKIILPESGDETSPYAANFDVQKLIKHWNPEWARRFVKYHPEYCKLQACMEPVSVAALNWDKNIQEKVNVVSKTSTITGATGVYAYQPTWLLNVDPFFKNDFLGKQFFAEMKLDLEQYSSRVLAVAASVKSLPKLIDFYTYCAAEGSTTNASVQASWDNCIPEEVCRVKDREWQDYRDKYFELKEVYYKRYRDAYCGNRLLCPIGEPLTVKLPGAMSTADFTVYENEPGESNPSPSCSSSQLRVRIGYNKGKVGEAVMLQIYYPGISEKVTVSFSATDTERYICVPGNLTAEMVKVSNIIQNEGYSDEFQ